MIIFYEKKTGKILGTVDGRVHTDDVLKDAWIAEEGQTKGDVGKFVVPFKPVLVEESVPVKEWRVVNKKTMRVEEVVVGKKKEMVSRGMEPDVPFADLISDFEESRKSPLDYSVVLDKKGTVRGLRKVSVKYPFLAV